MPTWNKVLPERKPADDPNHRHQDAEAVPGIAEADGPPEEAKGSMAQFDGATSEAMTKTLV